MGRSADFVGIAKPAANPPRPSPDLSPLRGERGAAAPFFSSPRSRGEGCGDAFFPLFPLAGRGRVRGAGDGRRPAKRAARRILPGRWAVPPRFVTFLQHAAGKRRLGPKFGIFGFEGEAGRLYVAGCERELPAREFGRKASIAGGPAQKRPRFVETGRGALNTFNSARFLVGEKGSRFQPTPTCQSLEVNK